MLDNDESFSMSGIQPTRFLASRQRGQAVSTGQNLKSGFCIPSRMKPTDDSRDTRDVSTLSLGVEGETYCYPAAMIASSTYTSGTGN